MINPLILQFNTLLIGILIEAIPFVLVGACLSSLLQVLVSDAQIKRLLPQNRILSICLAAILGILFPVCDCGIIPVVRRLIKKGVPQYAAVPFMLTSPILNPITLLSTYIAFGNSVDMMIRRATLALLVAICIGMILSFQPLGQTIQLKSGRQQHHHHHESEFSQKKWSSILTHTTEEFFSMGKFLLLGSFIAAIVQVKVPTSFLTSIAHGNAPSILTMMGLGYLLSVCSEADAFIAASFQHTFAAPALLSFMVFGAMIDLKNTFMLFSIFEKKFVILLVSILTGLVFLGSILMGAL